MWNARALPRAVAARVFQRYFTTKAEAGRGLGTYSMTLFGETYKGEHCLQDAGPGVSLERGAGGIGREA